MYSLAYEIVYSKKSRLTCRVNALCPDSSENRVFTTANGLVLIVHDCSSASGFDLSQVSSKPRDGWDHDDHSEFPAFFTGSDTSLNNGTSNNIVDGRLVLSRGSD